MNTTPIKNDTYNEISPAQLETLACHNGHINLWFSISHRQEEVLLVNSIEAYNRFRHLDTHAERFNPRSNSIPDGQELYETLSICNMANDNSHKLVIGTNTFTALITSSIRLDRDCDPELGPSILNVFGTEPMRAPESS
ncbi:hypothetical protein MBANPS3_000362 [Mucor bainieri]